MNCGFQHRLFELCSTDDLPTLATALRAAVRCVYHYRFDPDSAKIWREHYATVRGRRTGQYVSVNRGSILEAIERMFSRQDVALDLAEYVKRSNDGGLLGVVLASRFELCSIRRY